jgi:hypothetical protein
VQAFASRTWLHNSALFAFVLAEKTNLRSAALFRSACEGFHWVDGMDINGSTGLIPLYVDGVRAMGSPRGQLMRKLRETPNFSGLQAREEASTLVVLRRRSRRNVPADWLGRHREKSLSVSFRHVLCARVLEFKSHRDDVIMRVESMQAQRFGLWSGASRVASGCHYWK